MSSFCAELFSCWEHICIATVRYSPGAMGTGTRGSIQLVGLPFSEWLKNDPAKASHIAPIAPVSGCMRAHEPGSWKVSRKEVCQKDLCNRSVHQCIMCLCGRYNRDNLGRGIFSVCGESILDRTYLLSPTYSKHIHLMHEIRYSPTSSHMTSQGPRSVRTANSPGYVEVMAVQATHKPQPAPSSCTSEPLHRQISCIGHLSHTTTKIKSINTLDKNHCSNRATLLLLWLPLNIPHKVPSCTPSPPVPKVSHPSSPSSVPASAAVYFMAHSQLCTKLRKSAYNTGGVEENRHHDLPPITQGTS